MDQLFQALNDPTRRAILGLLRKGDRTAGEIAEQFDMTKPSISHHLDILKRADLILSEKAGQFLIYSLNTSVLDECVGWLMELRSRKSPPKKHELAQKRVAATPAARAAVLRHRSALG